VGVCEKKRGDRGVLIGSFGLGEGLGFAEMGADRMAVVRGMTEQVSSEVEMAADKWAPLVSDCARRSAPFRAQAACWARPAFRPGLVGLPAALFLFFLK
jgi:hypothetical protein